MATDQEPDSLDQMKVVIEAVAAGSVKETTTEDHANQPTSHLSTDSPSMQHRSKNLWLKSLNSWPTTQLNLASNY